ncbi:MAG TPA: class I SAM-dependent methyltransferase [Polyangiaceae bacterium]|nr:class I SAM-dependent methyltransferase [Polyangiaceae bacterium]
MAGVVRDVSDTARWVAHYRALEAERPNGILRDPFARRLAGERGRAIARALPKLSLEWMVPVRAKIYDELILEALAAGGVEVVVNLAAGLDARPYRLPLPAGLRWVEIDLPELIAEKARLLADERPRCELERVALDLTRTDELAALLARFTGAEPHVLVVTEGLLAYLDETKVRALAAALHAAPAVRFWIAEAAKPEVLARARRAWGKTLEPAGAAMKFAPASGLDFFTELGFEPRATRSLLEEAERYRREMRFAAVARQVTTWLRGREAWRKLAMYGLLEKA